MAGRPSNGRRSVLKLMALGVAGLTARTAEGMYQSPREPIQRPETPEAAMNLLVEGNKRFVAQNLVSFREDLDILKAHSEEL